MIPMAKILGITFQQNKTTEFGFKIMTLQSLQERAE
jgi:hypothetical protein